MIENRSFTKINKSFMSILLVISVVGLFMAVTPLLTHTTPVSAAAKTECQKNPKSKACQKEKADAAKKKAAAKKKPAAISPTKKCTSKTFFGLVPWYKYIGDEFRSTNAAVNDGDECTIKCFNFFEQKVENDCGQKHSDIPYVLLAVIDSLLRVAGLVAVVFVIVGSFKYITSQGNPEDVASAQSTLINALIGLAVAIVAVATVSFIGNSL